MEIKTIVVGPLETNCYILKKDDKCIIIDPGDDFFKIKKAVGNKQVVGCLVTHFHQDHISALEEVISFYNIEINKIKDSQFKFEIIETPGHTFDSRTFYFQEEKIMFCGDFIFKNGIGRTDLGGNIHDMSNSLQDMQKYDDDIILYPGHGEPTTLGQEKKNFYLYI